MAGQKPFGKCAWQEISNLDIYLAALVIGGLASSYVGVAVVIRWAQDRMLDIPNERSSHTRPTPRGGGLAILAVTLVGGSLFLFYAHAESTFRQWIFYFVGALLVAGVSWLDDLGSLPKQARGTAHAVAAIFVMLSLGLFRQLVLPGFGSFDLGWSAWPLTFLWIMGLTEAYNFMDGIDGIAAGQGIVAGLGWAIIGLIVGNPLFSSLGFLLAASCLGFLFHNWPPARIFMGDVGSIFLGYTFAVLAVIASQSDARLAFIGILFVWPFVFDAIFTFFRRLSKYENVFEAHRSHLYQRLVILGFSHRSVAITYICLALVGVLLGILWYTNVQGSGPLIWVVIPSCCIVLWGVVVVSYCPGFFRQQASTPVIIITNDKNSAGTPCANVKTGRAKPSAHHTKQT
jgi:UDP-N-acetylmuramyl pentapeptide phosphotransferase/UDP-N-acetylglucosamine-1-phosphate transferase